MILIFRFSVILVGILCDFGSFCESADFRGFLPGVYYRLARCVFGLGRCFLWDLVKFVNIFVLVVVWVAFNLTHRACIFVVSGKTPDLRLIAGVGLKSAQIGLYRTLFLGYFGDILSAVLTMGWIGVEYVVESDSW